MSIHESSWPPVVAIIDGGGSEYGGAIMERSKWATTSGWRRGIVSVWFAVKLFVG